MIVSKWLVDEELSKNSSLHFESISTIVASIDCEIRVKMLIKIEILSFQVASQIFFRALDLKGLFKFTLLTISKVALEMTFESHRVCSMISYYKLWYHTVNNIYDFIYYIICHDMISYAVIMIS